MSADEFPQSVVEAARSAVIRERGVHEPIPREDQLRTAFSAALAECERLGYHLIRGDEATVGRMAEALWNARETKDPSGERTGYTDADQTRQPVSWEEATRHNLWPTSRAEQRAEARLVLELLTAAQGGEAA